MNKNKNRNSRDARFQKPPQEFEQKVLDLTRVARMVAGGRRFNFRATVVVGNKKGKVGVGVAKGADVSIAINKATRYAQENIIIVPMTSSGTIPHEVTGRQTGSKVFLKPGLKGKGIVAGGAVRVICNLAGYKDITTKILSRSTNKLNIAIATINALNEIDFKPRVKKLDIKEKEAKKDKKPKDKKANTNKKLKVKS